MLYGNYIGVLYLLENQLDPDVLPKAWLLLQKQFPPLASRYDPNAHILTGLEHPIEIQLDSTAGHFADYVSNPDFDILRTWFVDEPNRKLAETGKAPMSTLTYTAFEDHGSMLGFAIAHVVTDAGGFHRLARQLADNYNALLSGSDIPDANFLRSMTEFNFGTNRSWEQTNHVLAQQGLKVPFSLQGVSGWFMRRMITWGMKHILSIERFPVHFTPDQVAQLKATVLAESGEDWISTNVALCAHFSSIMIELMHGPKSKKPIQLGQLLDLRNRYFEDPDNQQDRFIGNAILIHSELTDLGDYSRSNLARFFKKMTTGLSDRFITERMDITSDCFRHGRSYPGLDMKNPMVCVNNQTKMPVYDLDFAGVKPSHILPQDVGDNIMFFPSHDGGIDTYLRNFQEKDGHKKLAKPEWQARIFDL